MTGPERQEIAELTARLFGLDGSGEGGAIGRIEQRLTSLEKQFNRFAGAIALAAFALGLLMPRILDFLAVHP